MKWINIRINHEKYMSKIISNSINSSVYDKMQINF